MFFDAYGWDPEQGFDQALAAIGWTSTVSKGGDADEALARLTAAAAAGPGVGRPAWRWGTCATSRR